MFTVSKFWLFLTWRVCTHAEHPRLTFVCCCLCGVFQPVSVHRTCSLQPGLVWKCFKIFPSFVPQWRHLNSYFLRVEPHLNTYTAQQFRSKYFIVLQSCSTCNSQNKYEVPLKSARFEFFWPTNNTSHSLITKKYQNYTTTNNRNLLCTFASISKSYFHVITARLSFLKVTPE